MRSTTRLGLCIGLFVSSIAVSTGQPATTAVLGAQSTTPPAPPLVSIDDAALLPVPKLADQQLRELIQDVVTQYRLASGFQPLGVNGLGIAPPSGVSLVAAMQKGSGPNAETVVMGYATPARRLPQLWVAAWRGELSNRSPWQPLMMGAQGEFGKVVQSLLAERNRVMSKLSLNDLESRVLNLSYVDADAALFALRAMGYGAITDSETLATDDSYKGEETYTSNQSSSSGMGGFAGGIPTQNNMNNSGGMNSGGFSGGFGGGGFGGSPPSPYAALSGLPQDEMKRYLPKFPAIKNLPTSVNFDRLPLVVRLPATDPRNMGLVGSEAGMTQTSAQRDSLGLTVVPQAATNLTETVTGGTAQLLVMYHPAYPEQFQKLKRVIAETIDRPARQVVVEGLVLEISSEALSELGVKWDLKKGNQTWSLGTLTTAAPGDSAISFLRDSAASVTPSQMMSRINALVQNNKAEVLSRPSVLTLDNRQATIRVGTDIPIATSKDASSGSAGAAASRVSFSFQYLPTGILMNVRPRVSEDGQEISMLIDATVSATVPNQDLKVLDPATKVTLASAPTISTRRVQTYARIRDNQPLIIGGLVSRDQISGSDKVPLAGDIPLLGKLFGHENKQDKKREVIIVLTPSVVTENIRETKAQYPRDDDIFDLRDTTLFKEHYRLRAEDLVDSSYIRFNRRFLNYRDVANRLVDREPSLANRAAIAPFVGTRIPGEFIFVSSMMYRLMDRMKADEPIKLENIQTFERGANGEQRPIALTELLAKYGGGSSYKDFFDNRKGKALALTYRLTRNSTKPEDMFGEPVPTIQLVDCPDRATWRRLLWDMNQSTGSVPQYTILIHEREDLRRLQLAYATQNTILNNGGTAGMVFDRFLPGRMLHLQEVSPNWERVLLPPIAQYFFIGEHGTMFFMQEHERAIQALDTALRMKENAALLDGIALP